MPQEIVIRLNRTVFVRLLVLVAFVAISIPTAVWASNRFVDVPDTNVFHDDITALANAGVTLGCNPPTNDQYCPTDVVTREQMAGFLNRLGALDGQAPVVNASTVQGFGSEAFVFAPEPVAGLTREYTATASGGAPFECFGATALLFEPDFQVFHQLTSTPVGIDPWEVNVQLDTRGVNPGEYKICLATLDASNLPAGDYQLNGWMLLK